MCKTLKKINRIMQILFAGVFIIYGIAKVFDIVPKKNPDTEAEPVERATSEFDELW